MAHSTEQVNGVPFTSDEIEMLTRLLKHPKMQALAAEIQKEEEANK